MVSLILIFVPNVAPPSRHSITSSSMKRRLPPKVEDKHPKSEARCAPLLTDLLAGHAQVAFDNLPSPIEHIRAGKLRALAITTAKRSEALPDVPSLVEFLPGFETSSWLAVGAPSKTRSETVVLLNKEINAALADPRFKAKLVELGATPLANSPAETARFIHEETEKWRKVVEFSGVKSNAPTR
jgi:tripartite-type tricarboxylate transporter receptor subunit TctC